MWVPKILISCEDKFDRFYYHLYGVFIKKWLTFYHTFNNNYEKLNKPLPGYFSLYV